MRLGKATPQYSFSSESDRVTTEIPPNERVHILSRLEICGVGQCSVHVTILVAEKPGMKPEAIPY